MNTAKIPTDNIVNDPPLFLYKYCRREHVDLYWREAIRLSSTSYYRREYESGMGYGDKDDAMTTQLMCNGLEVRMESTWFIASFARQYSYADHRRWFEREGCGYDCCIEFKSGKLLGSLARATRREFRVPTWRVYGNCYYGVPLPSGSDLYKVDIVEHALFKGLAYEWEQEFRFALWGGPPQDTDHHTLQVPGLQDAFHRVYKLPPENVLSRRFSDPPRLLR